MRFVATAYALDPRPENDPKVKEAPKGGWRTKSGHRKLGKSAVIDAKTFGDAIESAAKLIGGLSPEAQKAVVRVQVAIDDTDPSSGDVNPFAS
jgi:hypothetical protein